MASRLKIGEKSDSSKSVSLPIAKGTCVIKGFKTESKTSLSPSNNTLPSNTLMTLQSVANMYRVSYQKDTK